MLPAWPTVAFDRVPAIGEADRLAEAVRAATATPADAALDVDRTCEAGGFALRQRRLGGARGGHEAMLVPRRAGFTISVDPEPRGGWGNLSGPRRTRLAAQRERFRVAHEIGHSFFYARARGRIPQRRLAGSPAQERWCDYFARTLLVPRHVARSVPTTAGAATELQSRLDVSLELALRALAGAHGQQAALWFWPQEMAAGPDALLRQWATAPDNAPIKAWREADLVLAAMGSHDEVSGWLPGLRPGQRRWQATALALPERRQVLVIAS